MKNAVCIVCLLCLLHSFPAAAQETGESASAARTLGWKIAQTEGAAEQVALIQQYVRQYPDNARVSSYLQLGVDLMIRELQDVAGARRLIEGLIAGTTNDDIRFEARKQMAFVLAAEGKTDELEKLKGVLAETRTLEFWDVRRLADAAFEGGMNELAVQWYTEAAELSTVERLKAEVGPRWTEDQIESLSNRRRGPTIMALARSQARLGMNETAAENFATAGELIHAGIFGVHDEQLDVHWASFLLRQGKVDEAIELIAPDALMARDPDALEVLQKAYERKTGDVDGFTAFAGKLHADLALPAPDFTLKTLDGEEVSLAGLKGKVVLLNFWFPACGPCRIELPRLKGLYERLHPQGLEIVCIDITAEPDAAREFIAAEQLPYVFADEGERNGPVSFGKFKVTAAPSNFIIDRRGMIVSATVGFEPGEERELEEKLKELLARD